MLLNCFVLDWLCTALANTWTTPNSGPNFCFVGLVKHINLSLIRFPHTVFAPSWGNMTFVMALIGTIRVHFPEFKAPLILFLSNPKRESHTSIKKLHWIWIMAVRLISTYVIYPIKCDLWPILLTIYDRNVDSRIIPSWNFHKVVNYARK